MTGSFFLFILTWRSTFIERWGPFRSLVRGGRGGPGRVVTFVPFIIWASLSFPDREWPLLIADLVMCW